MVDKYYKHYNFNAHSRQIQQSSKLWQACRKALIDYSSTKLALHGKTERVKKISLGKCCLIHNFHHQKTSPL